MISKNRVVAVVLVLMFAFGITGIVLAVRQQQADERARQACEQLQRQHDLQTALSGGQYSWARKDC